MIVFSNHALHQLRERKIPKSLVRDALSAPDRIIRQTHQRFRALKRLPRAGKLYVLVVVIDEIDNRQTVVTAFWTSKLRKYQ